MSVPAIAVENLGKKFNRSVAGGLWLGLTDGLRRSLGLRPRRTLHRNEFWALRDVSFEVRRGECLGLIGPNGAGKTSLLKLINRDLRPDLGRVATVGAAKSLIRIGSGLQPMYSGRENIYIQCAQLGLSKSETDAKIEFIVEFAGLKDAIDAPVKTYSDGMYARLEFAAATCVPMDILLIDEVLAVGDIAFQLRCLDRINELKQCGTAVVFVSHSEMNIRQVADRCLLLFDGRQLAIGEPDRLFYQYYAAVGYLNNRLRPLGGLVLMPEDKSTELAVSGLTREGREDVVATGGELDLILSYRATRPRNGVAAVLHFWTAGGLLLVSADSAQAGQSFVAAGAGRIRVRLPFLGLAPGVYRVAAGLWCDGEMLAYRGNLLDLTVSQGAAAAPAGLAALPAVLEPAPALGPAPLTEAAMPIQRRMK